MSLFSIEITFNPADRKLIRELLDLLRQKRANDELAEVARESLPDMEKVVSTLDQFTPGQ